jgi:hypothetical protein
MPFLFLIAITAWLLVLLTAFAGAKGRGGIREGDSR